MSPSVEPASAEEGLTFAEAFKKAVETGRSIRRSCWFEPLMLDPLQRTLGEWCLIRSPEQRDWSSEFSPNDEDVEADDWEMV